jgi:23S rRNA (uracil1939-C5)-methyltransferase
VKARPEAHAEGGVWVLEKLVPGGDALAHLADGRVAFVTGAFPGDTIRPLAIEAKKGHVRATRFELVSSSADRVAPPCPVAHTCGGCDWMGISWQAQRTHKEALLRTTLERTGQITDLPERLPFDVAGHELRYRSRVRFQVDAEGNVGFFARGSHALVKIPGCVVCRPEIDEALAALRRVSKDALGSVSEIEVRVADDGPRLHVVLVPRIRGGAGPALKAVRAALHVSAVVSVRGEESPDDVEQRFALPGGASLVAAPGVFTQVNWDVNVALVEHVVQGARARGVKTFLDAYAGAGNFSLPLLASGMVGTSIERDPRAVACARRAASAQGLPADGFLVGDASSQVAELARRGAEFDMVVLDPPRSGAKDVLDAVRRIAPRVIALCSCDPVTLARDLGTLLRSGHRLEEVRGFDMFPSTHHLEALAWITRST